MSSLPTRPLGHSGLATTIVGLGCNNFGGRLDLEDTRRVVNAALDNGITFFDTADIYGRHGSGASRPGPGRSEELLGEALKGRRDQVVLATKFGMEMADGYGENRGSAEYITRSINRSLTRLQTDHVDLYWYHRPDGVTPIQATLQALHELVQAGKVRAIGASNFSAAQLEEAAAVASEHGFTAFSALQNEYSLLRRDPESDGTLAACERLNVGFVPYFPLANGLLTGKYRRDGAGPEGSRLSGRDELASVREWDLIEAVTDYATERGLSLIQVAIGGLLIQPTVASVIAGATRAEQLEANATAAAWTPSDQDAAALSELLTEHAA
ncbi:MAG TPA: aldo/keto reductase [Solirubrobacteraceae bacterium]|nr:aldo/keto reductase [Solirubrobacteraceae bacterium]